MNNDFTSTYEYTVEQKPEGKFRFMKFAFISLYILYPVIFMAILFIIQLFQLFALVAVTEWMLVYFTWKYTKPEYEYSVTSGRVTFSVIHGKRSRKEMLNFAIKDCLQIAPATEREWVERLELYDPELVFSAVASSESPDRYYAAFENEDGKRCVFHFEATEKMLKLCRNYNSSHTVVTKVRY
ncbi:MAG: hypothetical protein J6S71_09320 [Clostridia bacterium]|nr:hypothetical protein [Clostridia bacterium]